ncbi:glycosyl transferase family 2 [Halothece sp. PCC 7418]|uniref:glycosyltransferase n=1 Tax=Halothece sp. (strain PCC 7418) TaxID=65093 RepID=UPI0002A07F78|nr:glycosyltransferase [Halothece sp. PCC 7418]AFZ45838.1 glycosyl transferase family 2 [Halothece sp. PCC 7418]
MSQTNSKRQSQILIITGMHRSGTSLATSLLHTSGLDVGDYLMSGQFDNIKGHFEDLDFVKFHEEVLASKGISTQGWTTESKIDVPEQFLEQAQSIIEKKQHKFLWGWKDPRTTLFLNFWQTFLPNAKFLFIYRSPWEVIDSLYRRGDGAFLKNPNLAIDLWCSYNEIILDFCNQNPESCLLSDIDHIIHNDQSFLEEIQQKFGIPLQPNQLSKIYNPSLFNNSKLGKHRPTIIQTHFPKAIEIYQKLNQNCTNILSNYKSDCNGRNSPFSNYQSWVLQDWLNLRQKERELKQIETELEQTQTELEKSQSQIYHYQVQLKEAQTTIIAMETSKFWKLRKLWFKCKNLLKSQLYVHYLNQLKLVIFLSLKYGIPDTIQRLRQDYKIPLSDDINYQKWLALHYPKKSDLMAMAEKLNSLKYQPVISIIMPVFNTPEAFLKESIETVLTQVYPHWELCIADDASTQRHIRDLLNHYQAQDARIKVIFRPENGHISKTSNSALELATGEYIALLDHDDLLTPDALYQVVKFLNQTPEADMIYSDEDKINEEGKLQDPYFKPDWCPDSFLSRMYTNHLGIYRHQLIQEIGGFREGYEGSQDYDLVLRLTEKTDQIFHLPKILYHWRIHPNSTAENLSSKNYATEAAKKALEDALKRREEKGKIVPVEGGHHIIRYEVKDPDLVSIIIPTKNLGNVLNTCLKSIFEKTTYPHYEVLVIDNGSTEQQTKNIFESWKMREPNRFRYETLDIPFNFSKLNNYGVEQTTGKYLLFLNNDTEVIDNDWLEAMVEQAQRPSIGAVGALLLHQDNTIQHAGVVGGVGGVAGHSHKYYHGESHGYFNQLKTNNNYSAVTAACLMCRREVFQKVGGFEPELAVAFNDVDLCFKMLNQGYKNICVSHVRLYHYESKSRGYDDTPEKQARFSQEVKYMKSKWKEFIEHDPCYNPNLTREREDFTIEI